LDAVVVDVNGWTSSAEEVDGRRCHPYERKRILQFTQYGYHALTVRDPETNSPRLLCWTIQGLLAVARQVRSLLSQKFQCMKHNEGKQTYLQGLS
jgi:hypothetical protein